jgi:acyl carrier protein
MIVLKDIYLFIEQALGIDANILKPDSDLFEDFGVFGDDLFELIDEFSEKYDVNIDNFLWYFHSPEEASSLFGIIFSPPNKRVSRIAITPDILVQYDNQKCWRLEYPAHEIPKRRWDILLSQLLFLALGVAGIVSVLGELLNE